MEAQRELGFSVSLGFWVIWIVIAVSWKLGHKVIYITLLTDQAIRQGRPASPRSITRTRTASWAVGRAAAAVSWSWPACAHSCSTMGQRCCVALLACLARAPMGLECFVYSARGPLFVFAFNIFPIYYLSFRIRRITVVQYDLFVSPSLQIFAIRYTIPMQGRIV